MSKVYVDVDVRFDTQGNMFPRRLIWRDGRAYNVERVVDVRPSHAGKCGGFGDRYTIVVCQKTKYLFFEHSTRLDEIQLGRWFVDDKG